MANAFKNITTLEEDLNSKISVFKFYKDVIELRKWILLMDYMLTREYCTIKK